jgi:hypothetical protein
MLLGLLQAISVFYQASFLYEKVPEFGCFVLIPRLFSILFVSSLLRHLVLLIPIKYWPLSTIFDINVRQYIIDLAFYPLTIVLVRIQFDVLGTLWPSWWDLLTTDYIISYYYQDFGILFIYFLHTAFQRETQKFLSSFLRQSHKTQNPYTTRRFFYYHYLTFMAASFLVYPLLVIRNICILTRLDFLSSINLIFEKVGWTGFIAGSYYYSITIILLIHE